MIVSFVRGVVNSEKNDVVFIVMKKFVFLIFFVLFSQSLFSQFFFSEEDDPLDSVHQKLEKQLSPELLAQIDEFQTKDDMVKLHHSVGTYIRNEYGLWSGTSDIYSYLYFLGLRHPDDMSSVILESFWCKRHGQEYDLGEAVIYYQQYWEDVAAKDKSEKEKYQRSLTFINDHMVDLDFQNKNIPTVSLPLLKEEPWFRARYLCEYNNNVFAAIRWQDFSVEDKTIYVTEPYLIDLKTNTIKEIKIWSLKTVESSLVLNGNLWCYGKKGKKHKLICVKNGKETSVKIPKDEAYAILGFCDDELIIVYSKEVYKYSDSGEWILLYSSEEELPRSGLPPQIYNDKLYLRDEGVYEDNKTLWILDLASGKLEKFYKKTGLVTQNGPRWENNSSYAVDKNGNLFTTAGSSSSKQTLISFSNTDEISLYIFEDTIVSNGNSTPISKLSAITQDNDRFLLAGFGGFFILDSNRLLPIVYFKNAAQNFPVNDGKNTYHWKWSPGDILKIDTDDYIISATFDGIFRLKKENDKWTMAYIDFAKRK